MSKEYTLGVTITLELDLAVQADSFPDAVEAYKGKKLGDFITIKKGVELNDNSRNLRSVSTGEWLNGQ
jgi:hypothetical protein